MTFAWILAAESSRAKVFALETRDAPLVEVAEFSHASGRMHDGDLVTDRSGNDGGRAGQRHHTLDASSSAREVEADGFARELAEFLGKAHRKGTFSKLVLIAPPQFLGWLRTHLSKTVSAAISEQIHKNLVRHTVEDVRAHLSDARPVKTIL